MKTKTGFEEIAHTADWAVRVWSPDLAGLFITAAEAMFLLQGTEWNMDAIPLMRSISIHAYDAEELLVAFLTELNYFAEEEKMGSVPIHIQVDGLRLEAQLSCRPITKQSKEIKAVTYHDLQIRENAEGVETVIVFDV